MADTVLSRALGAHFGPELHERLTGLLARSGPGEARAALAAVLERHVPVPGDWGTSCSCWVRHGSHPAWPCDEVTAIIVALSGGEKTDG